MYIFYLAVSMGASIIGSICGVGGGIIIKPLFDMLSGESVAVVSFLSGVTVLSMSVFSVISTLLRGQSKIALKVVTPLALGAVIGGLLGQSIFQAMKNTVAYVGAAQSAALLFTVLGSLLYTLKQDSLKTHRLESAPLCTISGVLLGMISAFIGIGGGPINLALFSYFFSMDIKTAVVNSLYIIMFSQLASTTLIFAKGAVPDFAWPALFVMILGGICGAFIGRRINSVIPHSTVRKLFIALMISIICLALHNIINL